MLSGTVLPFSAISGRSSLTLPTTGCLPPVNFLIRSAESLAAAAGVTAPPRTAARTAPAAGDSAWRRSTPYPRLTLDAMSSPVAGPADQTTIPHAVQRRHRDSLLLEDSVKARLPARQRAASRVSPNQAAFHPLPV